MTKGGTYTSNTSIKSPDFSLFNDIIMVVIHAIKNKGNMNLKPIFSLYFFDPRYLAYFQQYIILFVGHDQNISLEGTMSQFF